MSNGYDLYEHQQRAIDMTRESMRYHLRQVLQLPTGAGKTIIAAHIIALARKQGKRVTFTVPKISLVNQTVERFASVGVPMGEMGVIQADHWMTRPHAPVQVASVQSLQNRDFPLADLVIVDEAHVRSRAGVERWMERAPELRFLGLSATPYTVGLGKFYSDLIQPTSMEELIEGGFLSPFTVFAPTHGSLDLDYIKTTAGDYNEGQLSEHMQEPALVADIVSTWAAHKAQAGDAPFSTLFFGVDRAHSQKVHERFEEAGVRSAYIDAQTPVKERELIGARLERGDLDVVCNIGTLTTGVDWDIRCLIMGRPTKSEMLFQQIIGRALRTAPGKDRALILDHSDTHLRLGMVTDINYDYLDDGKRSAAKQAKERDLPMPKECLVCTALIPPSSKECPSCGADAPRPPPIEEAAGELTEMTSANQSSTNQVNVLDQLIALGKREVYQQLLWVRADRGYSERWPDANYREIFGVWPRGIPKEAKPAGVLLRSYVRKKMREYAQKKKREKELNGGST